MKARTESIAQLTIQFSPTSERRDDDAAHYEIALARKRVSGSYKSLCVVEEVRRHVPRFKGRTSARSPSDKTTRVEATDNAF